MTNVQLEYSDWFFSGFFEGWSPFYQSEFDQEDFVVDVIPVLLPFCKRNLSILGFDLVHGILNLSGAKSKADLAAKSVFIYSHSNVFGNPKYKALKLVH